MEPPFRIEPLSPLHDRGSFSCGTPALDNYFKTQATQDIRRYLAKCYVAIDNTSNTISGFYTLSASSVALDSLPQSISKNIRYREVPVTVIGRFATAITLQGRGIGTALLYYACRHAMNSPVGSFGIVVDAKEEKIKDWYIKREFEVVEELRLILTFKKLSQL